MTGLAVGCFPSGLFGSSLYRNGVHVQRRRKMLRLGIDNCCVFSIQESTNRDLEIYRLPNARIMGRRPFYLIGQLSTSVQKSTVQQVFPGPFSFSRPIRQKYNSYF